MGCYGLAVGLFFGDFLIKAVWTDFALFAFNDYIFRCVVVIIEPGVA
tara:strand:+ start:279 stop:419 length:141 start_codon:yes stop_codon:yes gene_type:complete